MGKFITWVIILVVVGIIAYGGYGLYQQFAPASASAPALQTVKLAKGNINSTVSADGTLRSNQSAQLSWEATGKVGTVNVKIGDKVTAGEVLESLDPTALPNSILTAQVDIVTAQQALANLVDTQSTLPAAQQAVIDAQTAVDNAQSHRDMMNYPTRGNAEQIASAQANYLRAEQLVDMLRTKYDETGGDPTIDHAKAEALTTLNNAITARNLALATLNWYKGNWTSTEIATADAALNLAKAKLADAQTTLATVKKGPDPQKIAAAQRRIDTDQGILDTQKLVAPIDGVVTVLNNKPGDLVNPGDVSIRIDDTSSFFIDLQVSELDVAKIKLGQPATVTFDAIPNNTYNATVSAISPVGTTINGVVSFIVTIQITNPDNLIKTGMTASANILVDSINNVLVVPAKAIKLVRNQNVVYVLSSVPSGTTPQPSTSGTINAPVSGETNIVVPVVVQEGASSDTHVQISSSRLKVGDLIVLNPPASAISETSTLLSSGQ